MELKTVGLTKRYGPKTAVDHLSVTLTSGVYGLLGQNGAGKTTLMRLFCTVQEPTSGKILLDGEPVREMGEEYRSLLGYLPQHFGYYPDFTALDFLLYMAAVKGLPDRAAKKRARELLEAVGLGEERGRKVKTFSGGMKQRLGIAQAVINDPHILVLDEPTAGLDPKERMRFRNLIAELAKDKIVILSTHIVSDIDSIADDILMIKKGRLILNCGTDSAIHSMDGKVWNCRVHPSQIDEAGRRFLVVNLHHESENEVLLRIVSDTQPVSGAVNVPPTLDDLYLYHFQDEEAGRG